MIAKPVAIFGDHEQKTIDQLIRVVEDDRVVAAALCADGHFGYSLPIGGVVAYQDAISPSGVGFDIACLSGDTRIFTLDGRHPTLASLEGDEVHVLACDERGTPVPAVGTALRTRQDAPFLNVILDSGQTVRCTPDHLFLTRDGRYVEAQTLTTGERLMPNYWITNDEGYVLVRDNSHKSAPVALHKLVADLFLGERPEGDIVVHHGNHDRSNNHPRNLSYMTRAEHARYHMALRDLSYMKTEEFEEHRLRAIQEFWVGIRKDDEFMAARALQASINGKRGAEKLSEIARLDGRGARGADQLRLYNQNARRARYGPVACPLCGEEFGAQQCLGRHVRSMHPDVKLKSWRPGRTIIDQLNSFSLGADNHIVLDVREVAERAPAFCLSVPGFNNFALHAGIFVHNCGNKAVRTDMLVGDLEGLGGCLSVMREINRRVSFGLGRSSAERVDHPLFDSPVWAEIDEPGQKLKQKAQAQLGTVGSGNHYVDLLTDDEGAIWVATHFGSRGFGHTVASGFLAVAAGKKFGDRIPESEEAAVLDIGTPSGDLYVEAMHLAGEYAYAGRDHVVSQVVDIMGAKVTMSVHNHHNFAWKENGQWVVRKGATPLTTEPAFIGGSMGDISVIVRGKTDTGVGGVQDIGAIGSAPHGAGRLMSRTKAAGKWKKINETRTKPDGTTYSFKRRVRDASTAAIDFPSVLDGLAERGIVVIGAGADEAPGVYKDLRSVLSAHSNIEVMHELHPIGVVMAGDDVTDPYAD